MRTDDGGATWKDQESGLKLNLFAVAAAGRDDALVVGDQGRVLQTRDGGLTWQMIAGATSVPLYGVAYRGGTSAWVAGRGGVILRRAEEVNTVSLPRPKIPLLKRDKPKLQTHEPDATLPSTTGDIPRAVPRDNKKPPR